MKKTAIILVIAFIIGSVPVNTAAAVLPQRLSSGVIVMEKNISGGEETSLFFTSYPEGESNARWNRSIIIYPDRMENCYPSSVICELSEGKSYNIRVFYICSDDGSWPYSIIYVNGKYIGKYTDGNHAPKESFAEVHNFNLIGVYSCFDEAALECANRIKLYKNSVSEENRIYDTLSVPILDNNQYLLFKKDCLLGEQIRVTAFNEEGIAYNTQTSRESAALSYSNVKRADTIKASLLDSDSNELYTITLAKQDTARLSSSLVRETDPCLITAVLLYPNYKGIITAKNGENDIRVKILPDAAYIADCYVRGDIIDSSGKILLSATADELSEEMYITYSSKFLKLGDYTLNVSMIDRSSGNVIDYNNLTLRKRDGDLSALYAYVDENGRYILRGKPCFYIGMYSRGFGANTEEIAEDIQGMGISSVFSYWQGTSGDYDDAWYEAIEARNMGTFPNMRLFYENSADRINFGLSSFAQEGDKIIDWVQKQKSRAAVEGYYVGDEEAAVLRDKIRWHNDILSTYDGARPTVFTDWRRGKTENTLVNNNSDILMLDKYPVYNNGRTVRNDEIYVMGVYARSAKSYFLNKPVWMALQCANYGAIYPGNPQNYTVADCISPTKQQLLNMAVQVICSGATGIWWYSQKGLAASSDEFGFDIKKAGNNIKEVNETLKSLENIIMSDEEPPRAFVTPSKVRSGNNSGFYSMAKRYNGKSYVFLANGNTFACDAQVRLDGAVSARDMLTGEMYTVSNGEFNVPLDVIATAVIEIEQQTYLSHDNSLKSISFDNDGQGYFYTMNSNEYLCKLPAGIKSCYMSCAVNDKAKLFVNGVLCGGRALLTSKENTIAIVAENGEERIYTVKLDAAEDEVSEISSDFYDINIGEKSISGVLRYTPADKFISRINIADGYEIDGIYNGNEKITSATVSAGNTLKLSNGSAYTISCVSDVVSGNGSYVCCYLKNETGHALQWQDNESGGAYSRLAIDVSMPKERSKTWQLRPIVKNSENMFMECSVGNSFYFANDRFTDRGNEVLSLAGDSDTIDIRLIVDLSSETGGSLTVYVNGHYLDCYYSNKFRKAFVPTQNGGEGYSEIYLTTSGGEKTVITSFFIDSTEELEKEITDFYDRIIFTDNNGSITASLTPSSYDNGMLILVSYDEAKGCIGGISVTRVTKKQETFKAALSADSIKGKVKAMYWSDKIEHRLLAEYN